MPEPSAHAEPNPKAGAKANLTADRPMDFVLAGPLRSGSSLLRLMLNHHPAIACVGEFEEAVSRMDAPGWPDMQAYREFLAQDGPTLGKDFTIDPDLHHYPDLVHSMWRQLTQPERKPVLGCCIHSRFDRVPDLWPDSKFIFLIRDPRDVALSSMRMGWAGEPTSAAHLWRHTAQRLLDFRAKLPPERHITVRYEHLVRNPEHELDRCSQLLGQRFDPAMLEFHTTSTYQPLNPAIAERWRREMSPRAAEIIDADSLTLLQHFDYQPSVPEPKPATTAERARLRLHNRLGRFLYRLKKYGIPLTIYWIFAKRLLSPTHPWRRAGKARINAIDDAHLQ